MKPFSVLVMLSFSLCASLCSCPEEDFANQYSIETEHIIRVQNNQNSFIVNDVITIETEIPNHQVTNNGEDILLTDFFYDDTLDTSFFQHHLTLYKRTGFETLSPIAVLNSDITTTYGSTETNNEFITAKSYFDENTNSFRHTFSINLRESGTFFLSNIRLLQNDFRGIYIRGGIYELGFVDILTTIENANENGAYEFSVTE